MRKEIVVRIRPESDKCRRKALKVAASVRGVESVSVTGRGNGLLLVIGDVDEVDLIKKLEEKVGDAELVDLRTLPSGDALLGTDLVVTQSPCQQWRHHSTPGRIVPGGGRIECPVSATSRQQQAVGYYPGTPSPLRLQYHHHPSPMAGQGGYGYGGSRDALAVARSHPGNYSPMIERHDYRTVDGTRGADVGHRREHDSGGGPSCCTIL